MPHHPKPFYRTARSAWYVQLRKKQVELLDGPDDSATADAAFHKLMAGAPANDNAGRPSPSAGRASGPGCPTGPRTSSGTWWGPRSGGSSGWGRPRWCSGCTWLAPVRVGVSTSHTGILAGK